MNVPVVKTLLKYRDLRAGGFYFKDIVIDFNDGEDEYETFEYIIEANNPFDEEYEDLRFECSKRDDGSYSLTAYNENYKPIKTIDAFTHCVLEFKGKYFDLQEVK